jgi:hypothetical protein
MAKIVHSGQDKFIVSDHDEEIELDFDSMYEEEPVISLPKIEKQEEVETLSPSNELPVISVLLDTSTGQLELTGHLLYIKDRPFRPEKKKLIVKCEAMTSIALRLREELYKKTPVLKKISIYFEDTSTELKIPLPLHGLELEPKLENSQLAVCKLQFLSWHYSV